MTEKDKKILNYIENANSIYEAVEFSEKNTPGRNAMEFQGKGTSYKRFLERIDKTAKAYFNIGIGIGQRVLIIMPNMPQAIVSIYALNKIGAISSIVHPLSASNQIRDYLDIVQPDVVLTFNFFFDKVSAAVSCYKKRIKIIVCGASSELVIPLKFLYKFSRKDIKPVLPKHNEDVMTWGDFIKNGKNCKAICPVQRADDTAVILFSGGTTGTPKAIELTNKNLNTYACSVVRAADINIDNVRMLSIMPIFHGFGLGVGIHTALSISGTCALIPRFSKETYGSIIKRLRPTVIPGVPTLFEAMINTKGLEKSDLSFIDLILCGGDSLPQKLKTDIDEFLKTKRVKVPVREGYGLTECVAGTCLMPENNYKFGTVGVPCPGAVYGIFDPVTDEKLKTGDLGEIRISGPMVMKGYFRNEKETRESFYTDENKVRWLKTGDLGTMDDEGFITFKQRLKRMIIVSGVNVYPVEIEKAINGLEGVAETSVIGIPDEYKMHAVKAFVVLSDGVEATEAMKSKMIENLKKTLSKYALPKEIEFIKSLPQTAVGKVAYKKLEELEKKRREGTEAIKEKVNEYKAKKISEEKNLLKKRKKADKIRKKDKSKN
ncbi:MAG: class I adenylate-forming enzyme family protein [Candidatus Fimenecus sp.]